LKFAPTKIIVKNISYKVKQHELWTFFERYGKVLRATIVTERRSRRSRGFGFVVFANPLDAERALKSRKTQLHLKGRYMQVLPGTRKKGSMYSAKNAFKDNISQYMMLDEKEVDKDLVHPELIEETIVTTF